MLIHSIVPYEQMFDTKPLSKQRYEKISGGCLELTQSGKEEYISRIISTNPADYLNPLYAPGSPFPSPSKKGRTI